MIVHNYDDSAIVDHRSQTTEKQEVPIFSFVEILQLHFWQFKEMFFSFRLL